MTCVMCTAFKGHVEFRSHTVHLASVSGVAGHVAGLVRGGFGTAQGASAAGGGAGHGDAGAAAGDGGRPRHAGLGGGAVVPHQPQAAPGDSQHACTD